MTHLGVNLSFLVSYLLLLSGAVDSRALTNGWTAANPPTPSEAFERSIQIDSNGAYWLFWTANKTHVKFETHVQTFGYVGFGFSGNGQMYPGDVVVGWVKDGATYFKDCHTTGHVMPIVDTKQNWELIHGLENENGTVLKFVRKLDTCDDDDVVITAETMRVIFAFYPDDPASFSSLPWHGDKRRGTRSLLLLAIGPDPTLPPDIRSFDVIKHKYHVPNQDTTYQCSTMRIPTLQRKHHIVKYEPVIQKGNELHVHHMILYSVVGVNDSRYDNISYDCTNPKNEPPALANKLIFLAWAIGGREFYFPEETGISIGLPEDPTLFVLETHYDNPTLLSDIVDSSGLRFYFTPTLRKYDSGLIYTSFPNNMLLAVPPHEKQWISTAYCAEECMGGLPEDGVNVYAVFQHAHLLARGIVTRHFRNGTELKPFAQDLHYDFNFQDIRVLSENVKLKKGDRIDVECFYDSTGRTNMTYGGESTHQEMCLSTLLYYPKQTINGCGSYPTYEAINKSLAAAIGTYAHWDWSQSSVREKFRSIIQHSNYSLFCIDSKANPPNSFYKHQIPVPEHTYSPPSDICPPDQDTVFG